MKKIFSPLSFLAALGAGGISIMPFVFLQYVHPHGEGLITLGQVMENPVWPTWVYGVMMFIMVMGVALHLVLSIKFFTKLVPFVKSEAYTALIDNPIVHTTILAPFLAIIMTLNVFVGPVRFFVPLMSDNLQMMMLPALIAWLLIGFFLLKMEFRLLATAFEKGFDVSKIHFGWLLHSFTLAMFTVTGTGLSVFAKNPDIAHTAAFVALMTGSMGMFLFVVKIVTIFQSHLASDGLPQREFMPSFMIVLPSVTLYAISLFRFGHYLEHHHNAELGVYYMVVIASAFAFSTWYLMFSLTLLKKFITQDYFSRNYYVQLWGLVCPFVAYTVLGVFFYATFVPWIGILAVSIISGAIAIGIFIDLLSRLMRCNTSPENMNCS